MINNSIVFDHFLPSSVLQQSIISIRRSASTGNDSEDSGVDPVNYFIFIIFLLFLLI